MKNIEEEHSGNVNGLHEAKSSYERIKKILDDAKGKDLFKDIDDASEWQSEIRNYSF